MTAPLDEAALGLWLRGWALALRADETRLTELDAAIGDGDHGTNMARGATRLLQLVGEAPDGGAPQQAAAPDGGVPGQAAPAADAPDPAAADGGLAPLAKSAGMALISSVGGAAGPLYGTFWLRFATQAGDSVELDAAGLAAAFDAGAQGVAQRGRAELGDKTMLDVLLPAAAALAGDPARALVDAAAAARAGLAATEPLVARRGRASYLGERSAGHLDPGAASSVLLVEALSAALTTTLGAGA